MKTVAISVRSVDAMLDVSDSAVAGPRLHPDVVEAIWSAVGADFGALRLRVAAPDASQALADEVAAAVHGHFAYERGRAEADLEAIFRDGWRHLAIGIAVILPMLGASALLDLYGHGWIATATAGGLAIACWVALWNPCELLLYAHLPVRRRRRLAAALAVAEVEMATP